MGANQSTLGGNDDFTQTTNGELKTCYYELLGVDRQASDEEYVSHTLVESRV